jgi:hypothetical protein
MVRVCNTTNGMTKMKLMDGGRGMSLWCRREDTALRLWIKW